jgi:hypothetical protein
MSEAPQPGTRWAGFHLEEQLGAGGFGRVFAARDGERGRRVAVHVVDQASADDDAPARFAREVRRVGELAHPGIVPIGDVGEHAGAVHVVMPLLDGGNLRDEIHRGPLGLGRTTAVVERLGSALDRAHAAGIVHGNVRPTAVVREEDTGHVFLGGFGEPVRAPEGQRAPELRRGEGPAPATDVHDLGSLVFECLTGRVPSRAGLTIGALRPDLPAGIEDVVVRALADDPSDRYPTAGALAAALARLAADDQGAAAGADGEEVRPVPVVPGPSVFAGPGTATATPTMTVLAPDDRGSAERPRYGRRVVDGAIFGVYEDDEEPTRAPLVVGLLLTVAVLVVGLLAWRAANTDAELEVPAEDEVAASPVPSPGADLSVERLEALVADDSGTCVPPHDQPTDAPPRVILQCPGGGGVPDSSTYILYGSVDDRDDAFDQIVEAFGIPAGETDCGFGQPGTHDYISVDRVGRIACQSGGGRVDFIWTSDEAPLLASASGGGRFGDYYRYWAGVVERTDAAFPVAAEQVVLDAVPAELATDCRRDIDLLVQTAAVLAVTCEPSGTVPSRVSWVRFPSDEAMTAWMAGEESSEPGELAPGQAGCSPQRYELAGTTGRVVCRIGLGGAPVLSWTRDGQRLASVAVADGTSGFAVADLRRWWEAGGHRP